MLQTIVSGIQLPQAIDESYKYIKGAIQAYPELYFAKLVTGAIEAGRRIGQTFSCDQEAIRLAADDFRRAYPALSDVQIVDQWTGPIDRTGQPPRVRHAQGRRPCLLWDRLERKWRGPELSRRKNSSSLTLARNEWSSCALVNRPCRTFRPTLSVLSAET